jgi:hypothetical protein
MLKAFIVLGVRLLLASKLFLRKKTNETFDDVKWLLIITWVAPECQDIVNEHTYRGDKRAHEKRGLGIKFP